MEDTTSRKKTHLRAEVAEPVNEGPVGETDAPATTPSTVEPAKAQAIIPEESESSKTLRVLQNDFEALRQTLTCKICEKLCYEPYVLSCGHTYCYRCVSTWFSSIRKMSCPNCRVRITQLPTPSYAIKEMVAVFAARTELLPEGETMEDHETWSKEEAEFLQSEKNDKDPRTGGLFRGRFRRLQERQQLRPITDTADNVARCPHCNWELEDDSCQHCGIHFGSDGYESMSDDAYVTQDDDIDTVDEDFEPIDQAAGWFEGEMTPNGGSAHTSDTGDDDHLRHHLHVGRPFAGLLPTGHEDYHHNAHAAAIRAHGRPWRLTGNMNRLTRALRAPMYPRLRDDDHDQDEDDEEDDNDEAGSLDGFVVEDDDDGPITISSGEEDEDDEPIISASRSYARRRRGTSDTGRRDGRLLRRIIDDDDDDDDDEHNVHNSEDENDQSGIDTRSEVSGHDVLHAGSFPSSPGTVSETATSGSDEENGSEEGEEDSGLGSDDSDESGSDTSDGAEVRPSLRQRITNIGRRSRGSMRSVTLPIPRPMQRGYGGRGTNHEAGSRRRV